MIIEGTGHCAGLTWIRGGGLLKVNPAVVGCTRGCGTFSMRNYSAKLDL